MTSPTGQAKLGNFYNRHLHQMAVILIGTFGPNDPNRTTNGQSLWSKTVKPLNLSTYKYKKHRKLRCFLVNFNLLLMKFC